MLPKINRLKKKKEIENIFKKGKTAGDGFLTLKILQNNSNISRFAFVVSKKVSTKAVVRNKVRRRLSATIENNFQIIKKGFDVVLVALPSLKNEDFIIIKKRTENLLTKAKLFLK
jgi:ribonuclease P protein component